jgi:hypothetical protein
MENMEFLKDTLAEMKAKMDATQEIMDVHTKEMQARMKDTITSQIDFPVSRMEADRKKAREEMKAAIQSIRSERVGR